MKPWVELLQQPIPRQARARTKLLTDVVDSIDDAPICEAQIHTPGLYTFGHHDSRDGSIIVNTPLLVTLVAIHELTHRVHPEWSERTVTSRGLQLLQMLDDHHIEEVHARVMRRIRIDTDGRQPGSLCDVCRRRLAA